MAFDPGIPVGEYAMADAAWHRNPSGGRRYHKIKEGGAPACGLRQLLIFEKSLPYDEVPEVLRCRRNGCRQ